jgi:hypothetical protein
LNVVRGDAHGSKLGQSSNTLSVSSAHICAEKSAHLENNGALENDQHESGKERIVPVLVQHPQRNTEDLEDEEWCNGMFSEELGESGNGDMALVLSVRRGQNIERRHGGNRSDRSLLGRCRCVSQDSFGGFELGKRRAVIARIRDPGESLGRC